MVSSNDSNGVQVDADALIAQRAFVLDQDRSDPAISALPGGFAIRRRGNGQVVSDSRAYVSGDDIRHVDRGATARTGSLHIRTFHEERDRVTFLVADFRPSMLWGMRRAFRSVAAAESLARLGWQAVETGGRVGLMAITSSETVFVPSRGRTAGMLAVIGGLVKAHAIALDTMTANPLEPSLDQALAALPRVVPRGSAVIVASGLDTRGPNFAAAVGNAGRNRDLRFMIIEDRVLWDLPRGKYPTIGQDGKRRASWFAGGKNRAENDDAALAGFPVVRVDAGSPVSNDILPLAG